MDQVLQAGSQLGKYHIIRQLSDGHLASVFLARDPFIDREVALKVAPVKADDDSPEAVRLRERFFREAQTAGALRHPNIATIFDAGVAQGHCYIAMEFVPGGRSVEPYTRPGHLLPLDEITRLLSQCALALDYAHRRGVLHRDIKPGNVLVGEQWQIKLTDFGGGLAQSHELPQSICYQPPEELRGGERTSQGDLYALGVLGYQLLTGATPFPCDDPGAMTETILRSRPRPLGELRAGIPDIFQRIIDRALARNPAQRYRTGADMAGDLALVFDFLSDSGVAVPQQEKFSELCELEFFKDFAEDDLWEIVHGCDWLVLNPGDPVVREGDIEPSFFVIVSGRVAVKKYGREIVELKPGDCFGEMGLITGRQRSATVEANTPVVVIQIRAETIDRMPFSTQNRFQRQFLFALISRLELTTDRLANPAPT